MESAETIRQLNDMKRLISKLNEASFSYYNGFPTTMSDEEFDSKLRDLEEFEHETGIILSNSPTQNVGAKIVDEQKKVKHIVPMLSLEKCHSTEEVEKFVGNHAFLTMLKLDGLSVRLIYENGELVQAVKRGDGEIGEDITEHAKMICNVPLKINYDGKYIIDGEAIITDDDFEKIKSNSNNDEDDYKNSRNLVSGTLAAHDTQLVRERLVKFIAWDVIEGGLYNSLALNLRSAELRGFTCVPCFICNLYENNAINILNEIESVLDDMKQARDYNKYPCDGFVFKFNNIEYSKSLGRTLHHFKCGIALKEADDLYETTLTDIEWNTTRTGLINPVAIFEPVDLNGALTTRATLHNVSYIEDLELGIGDKIQVRRANMVIPKVHGNITRSNTYQLPTKCPCCGEPVTIVKQNDSKVLMCKNDNCRSKLIDKIIHFCSKNAMNIKGMGDSTIEFLVNLGRIKDFSDIYNLPLYREAWIQDEGFDTKSVDGLLEEIAKSRDTTFERFVFALGITSVGRGTSKLLAKAFNNDIDRFFDSLHGNEMNVFTSIDGIGEDTYLAMNKWFKNNLKSAVSVKTWVNIQQPNEQNTQPSSVDLTGKTFVITGSLTQFKNRDELVKKIESLGGKVAGSVSKNTSYLINNDSTSKSSKNVKATALNIPIITEQMFVDMIG